MSLKYYVKIRNGKNFFLFESSRSDAARVPVHSCFFQTKCISMSTEIRNINII